MSVTVTDILAGPFFPNGVTTEFPFDFKIPTESELRVFSYTDNIEVDLDPGLYSVTIASSGEGGTVNFTLPPAASLSPIFLEVAPVFTQVATFNNSGFLPRTLNPNFDRAAIRDLWIKSRLDRALLVPFGEDGITFPSAEERALNVLAFDEDGNLQPLTIGAASLLLQAQRREFTAAAGQTDFAFLSAALQGFVSVYLNGVRLSADDFSLNATTVSLTEPASVGDIVVIEGFVRQAGVLPTAAEVEFTHAAIYEPGSIGEKLKRFIYLTDAPYSADTTGVVDCTEAFQDAVLEGDVVIPGPGNYTMSYDALGADVSIPGNRKIHVQKGAVVTMTGGRFTAENVENVEWLIDGWVKSVNIRAAAQKPLWSASADFERGFIEFGSDYAAGTAASGFTVHGSGIVSGDWDYTAELPNFSDSANQVNKKGIACWNAKNVLVRGLEVFGFEGEAVYAFFFDPASTNIVFEHNYVHDTRFTALNFNAGNSGLFCRIHHNQVRNAYQIEASVGDISDNHIEDVQGTGVYTGTGAGTGPITISRNTIINAATHGVAAVFASGSPVTGVVIKDNVIKTSGQYGVYTDYCDDLVIEGNRISGSAQTNGAYDIGVNHCNRGRVSGNTFLERGPLAVAGGVAIATSVDVWVDPATNRYIPTTGAALPFADTKDRRTFSIAKVLNNGDEIILPTLAAGEIMKVEVLGPAGIGAYTATTGGPSAFPGNDAGYTVGGGGTTTIIATGTPGQFKIVNVAGGNTFPHIVEGVIA